MKQGASWCMSSDDRKLEILCLPFFFHNIFYSQFYNTAISTSNLEERPRRLQWWNEGIEISIANNVWHHKDIIYIGVGGQNFDAQADTSVGRSSQQNFFSFSYITGRERSKPVVYDKSLISSWLTHYLAWHSSLWGFFSNFAIAKSSKWSV